MAHGRVWTGKKSRGPKLDAEQQQWLQSFTENPLGIYEVREVTPAGMAVVDLAAPDRSLLQVLGRAIPPEAAEPSALVATRLLPEGEHWIRTVAWYPFERSLLPKIEEAIAHARTEWGELQDRRWFLGFLLAELWCAGKAQAHLSPEELETARKSEWLQVTDTYRIVDGDRLSVALSTAECVEGNHELGWTRWEPPANTDEAFWIHALNPGADGSLGLFALSRLRADEGREWLEGLAGSAVIFEQREIRDKEEDEIPAILLEGFGTAPAAEKTARMQMIMESTYADWAETPIPILDGKPPALAVRSAEGRQRVMALLQSYEQEELEAARQDLRDAASYRFLWDAVGLDRGVELREAD